MRNVFAVLLFGLLVGLSGCAVADFMAGIERDEHGKVTSASGGLAERGLSILDGLLFGGTGALSGLGGYALRAYRTKQIIASGGKDDNRDGIPDPEPKKEA